MEIRDESDAQRARSARRARSNKLVSDEWIGVAVSVVGGPIVAAAPLGVLLATGRGAPAFALGFVGLVAQLVAGVLLPSLIFHLVMPHVPIRAKDHDLGMVVVERSMRTRRIFLATAVGVYVCGAALFLFSTKAP